MKLRTAGSAIYARIGAGLLSCKQISSTLQARCNKQVALEKLWNALTALPCQECFWLNEGFTKFGEDRIMNNIHGPEPRKKFEGT